MIPAGEDEGPEALFALKLDSRDKAERKKSTRRGKPAAKQRKEPQLQPGDQPEDARHR